MILYNSTETEFKSMGLGKLADAYDIDVVEGLNEEFEISFSYPIDAPLFNHLKLRNIVFTKPSPFRTPQPFRIYTISTPINRTVTIGAEHISYDASGYTVEPFNATSCIDAITKLKNSETITTPFNYFTDITNSVETGEIRVTEPKSIRSILGSNIKRAYAPEYLFDKFTIYVNKNRGSNNGVVIKYGKNLTDINQEETNSNVYTHIYPYYNVVDKETFEPTGEIITIPGKLVKGSGEYNYTRIYPLDLSNEFDEKPTKEDLTKKAEEYIEKEKIGIPKVNMTLSFVQLSNAVDQHQIKLIDKIELGDTLTILFEAANIKATARCIKTHYNPMLNRYTSIEIGEPSGSLTNNIIDSSNETDDKIKDGLDSTKSYFEKAIGSLTNDITGNNGGYVRINPPRNPSEILVMDTDDINTAVVVWRWNQDGLGVSRTGYNGPYVGIGQNGRLVINEATAMKFTANLIEAGLLKSIDGKTSFNLDSGLLDISNGNIIIRNILEQVVMSCNSQGWLQVSNLFINGAENPSNLEIGGSDGNKGVGIRTNGAGHSAYLDFGILDKEATFSENANTGQYHRFITHANQRNRLELITPHFNIRNFTGTGNTIVDIQGFLNVFNDIKTQQGITASGRITAAGFSYSNGYALIGTDSISTIKYASNSGKAYLQIDTPKFGTWGADIWASDEILKENIENSQVNALEVINNISCKSFKYIDGINVDNGFIAQELAEISEDLVMRIPQNDGSEILQPRASGIIPWITKAIQEQNVYVRQLEEENKSLKDELDYQLESNIDNDLRITELELDL